MREVDFQRRAGIERRTRERLAAQGIEARATRPGSAAPEAGIAVVLRASSWWAGKHRICDLEVLSAGRPTGIRIAEALAYEAVKVGDVVSFRRGPSGAVEITAGSGARNNLSAETILIALPTGWGTAVI